MRPFVVGIPTLLRYDCLEKAIDRIFDGSTAKPERVYVIDNGGKWEIPARLASRVHCVRPRSNLGVSASWNMLARLARPELLILMNDDIYVGPDTLEKLVNAKGPCIATALGWACFRQDHEVFDTVGDYDERLYPAYMEDNDYDLRRQLAGVPRVILENDVPGLEHVHSATVKAMSEFQRKELDMRQRFNEEYYRRKWGGPPGHETLSEPFGRPPGSAVGGTDDLGMLYRRYCIEPSDIQAHVPRICALAKECRHVTEFGVGYGRSTVAILQAQPAKLISYEVRPLEPKIGHLTGVTTWEVKAQDTLAVRIEPTEMLLIDSLHTYGHCREELRLHSPDVSKYIVLHDTVSYGEQGEDGLRPGIWQAIQDFLSVNSDFWRLVQHYTDSNGLAVLERIA
jgi:hypothetical protein